MIYMAMPLAHRHYGFYLVKVLQLNYSRGKKTKLIWNYPIVAGQDQLCDKNEQKIFTNSSETFIFDFYVLTGGFRWALRCKFI